MKEILDQEIQSSPGDARSRKACKYFIANLFCLIILMGMTFSFRGKLNEGVVESFFMSFILLFIALSLLGFRNAMLSLIKQEKWSYLKIVGLLGNTLFFAVVLLLFISNVVDILNWAN